MDPEAREAFKAQRRAEDRERIEAAVLELASSNGWRRWIEARGRFHNYSLNNCMLIAMQCPDATQVASYKVWQSLGRQVRKGEHGIRILAPMVVGKRSNGSTGGSLEAANTVAQQVAANRVSLTEGEAVETRLLFRAVSVFDVGQTDGDDLPALETEPISGDSLADRLPQLEAFAQSIGYAVEYRNLSADERGGWCAYDKQLIVVDSSKPANAQVRVLVHEIAHALGVSSKAYGRENAEVIVESVAIIVLGALGLDTSGESIPYVASWGDGDVKALKEHAATVDQLASRIEKALEIKQ